MFGLRRLAVISDSVSRQLLIDVDTMLSVTMYELMPMVICLNIFSGISGVARGEGAAQFQRRHFECISNILIIINTI